jgi:hypothetical protein
MKVGDLVKTQGYYAHQEGKIGMIVGLKEYKYNFNDDENYDALYDVIIDSELVPVIHGRFLQALKDENA